jgi:hypothetical protein
VIVPEICPVSPCEFALWQQQMSARKSRESLIIFFPGDIVAP